MTDVISKITISEVILLFVLIFILPVLTMMLMRLRRYEAAFGPPPEGRVGKRKGKSRAEEPAAPVAAVPPAPAEDAIDATVFPYRGKAFLSPADRACLVALREVLGEVDVYPKVAVWETIESTSDNPGYAARLHDKSFDFLVCDARTGQPLTAVVYKPTRGRPVGPVDELQDICDAAGTNIVLIDMAEEYDAKSLKEALGLPDLDM